MLDYEIWNNFVTIRMLRDEFPIELMGSKLFDQFEGV